MRGRESEATPPQVDSLRPGIDWLTDFEFWGCVPRFAKRVVRRDPNGELFVRCREGKHYLDGQIGEDGELVGAQLCCAKQP